MSITGHTLGYTHHEIDALLRKIKTGKVLTNEEYEHLLQVGITNLSTFSGDYNDLENAPDISEDDSGDLVIADKDGNIIFRSNGSGFETVNLAVQNITIDGKTIQEMIQEYVNSYLNT